MAWPASVKIVAEVERILGPSGEGCVERGTSVFAC